MWQRTGHTLETAFTGVTLEAVMSDAGEGVGYDVVHAGRVIGRVQEYAATIELGKGLVQHGATWAFTPLGSALGQRWAKSEGQTIFGFATWADALRHALVRSGVLGRGLTR